MSSLHRLMSKCKTFFRRCQMEAELEREITSHLALMEDDFLRKGMSAEEAHLAARRAYGGVEQAKQMHRDERSILWLEQLGQDIRYAIRQLCMAPGFAMTVILTIALGIGANTAIFTLMHAILLKSLPVGDPKSLIRIGDKADCCLSDGMQRVSGDFDIFSYPLYRSLLESTPEFAQLAAMQAAHNPISVRRGNNTALAQPSEFVTGNYFSTLGVGAFAGRTLTDADDQPGAAPAVVMSYQAWQSDYGSDLSVVGTTFYLQSHPVTVVGIAPPGFFGDRISPNPPAFWIPLSAEPLLAQANSILHHPDECWLYLLGRVRPGVALGPLQEKISSHLRQWIAVQAEYKKDKTARFLPRLHVILTPGGAGIQDLQDKTGNELYLLLTVSGFVLLVACANVANLLLARGAKRKTEISMRMALGAARPRLMRQMLSESMLLSCLGGLSGLAFAYAGTRSIVALAFPDSLHSAINVTPSLAVLGFAFVLSLITGVVFGIVPAWITSRGDPAEALKGANRAAGDRGGLPLRSLIVFQAALSVVLLVGAALLTRSLRNLEHQDFGFQTANRYVLHLDPLGAGYQPEKLDALNRSLEQQFAAIPGMESVGLAIYSPLDGNDWNFDVYVPGRPKPGPQDDNSVLINRVSPNFFAAVGQPVIRGRSVSEGDTAGSQFIAVINQAFAKKYFPNEDPIGRHFGVYNREDFGAYEIVGVVANAKYKQPRNEAQAMFFAPLSQWQHNLKNPTAINLETQTHYITSIVMSFRGVPQNLDATLHGTLANIDPNLTILDLRSLDQLLTGNFNQERLVARLTALFGLLTLVLASVGLYGITSYQVAQRTREIGLRMALGAQRNRMASLVMRGALIQVVVGLAVGVPISLLGAHWIQSQLYAVKSYDPLSLFMAIVALSTAAVVASFLPARRAASIDPMEALRAD